MPHRRLASLLLAAVLVAGLTAPVAAASPATPTVASILDWLADWWAGVGEDPGRAAAASEGAPLIDPNGATAQPFLPGPEQSSTQPPPDAGEGHPLIDPDG